MLAVSVLQSAAAQESAADTELLAAIAGLDRELQDLSAEGHADEEAQRRLGARYDSLRVRAQARLPGWPTPTIAAAFTALHRTAANLHFEDAFLLAELELALAVVQTRPAPRHGQPALLVLWTDVSYDLGNATACAEAWRQVAEEWEHGPKKAWICAEAARRLINKCDAPDLAAHLAGDGLRMLESLPEWGESVRTSLLGDADLWLTMKARPLAASRIDCRGQLQLLRGFALVEANRLHEALDALSAAREDLQASANEHRLVNVEHNLANLWLQLGRTQQAIEVATSALSLYARSSWSAGGDPDLGGVRAMQRTIAQGLLQRRSPADVERARKILEQIATPTFLRRPGETNVDALCTLAEVLLAGPMTGPDQARFGEVIAALRAFCKPRRLVHRLVRADLLDAEWALRRAGLAAARVFLDSARTLLDQHEHLPLRVRRECLLGHGLLAAGQPGPAMDAYVAAGRHVTAAVERERLWTIEAGVGTYQLLHSVALRGAFDAFTALAATDPAVATERLYEIVQTFHGFESACLWLDRATDLDEAGLDASDRERLVSLRARAHELEESLSREQRRPSRSHVMAALRADQANGIRRQIDDVGDQIAALRAKVVSPALPRPASLAAIRVALAPGEVLIECVDLGDRTVALCVDRTACAVHALPDSRQLLAAVTECQSWSEGTDATTEPDRIPALRSLAGLLLPEGGWLDTRLADPETKTLLFSPEGPLCRVPFAALPWRGRPLVERVAVAHVISGTVLAHQRSKPGATAATPDGALLALANPRYPPTGVEHLRRRTAVDAADLQPLPASAHEALEVARLWAAPDEQARLAPLDPPAIDGAIAGNRFRVLLGAAARESALTAELLRGVRFLHFACHAKADVESPPLSFLALTLAADASSPSGEGLLRLGEFSRLRGDYELLALSGCETGAGAIRGHEGPASMA
ncbi:MAG: CHAT domain-containing protein, partial [Planctomycetota bacterium]